MQAATVRDRAGRVTTTEGEVVETYFMAVGLDDGRTVQVSIPQRIVDQIRADEREKAAQRVIDTVGAHPIHMTEHDKALVAAARGGEQA